MQQGGVAQGCSKQRTVLFRKRWMPSNAPLFLESSHF